MKYPITLVCAFLSALIIGCGSQNKKDNQKLPRKPQEHPIAMVVHRGANHLAPENTYPAAQKCIEMGLDYVEIDVRQSKDSVFYIIHDATVDRTTDGTGKIADLTSHEIDELDAGGWFDEAFQGEKIPQLVAYLDWIKGKAKVYLDVKAADLGKLVTMIQEKQMNDDVFFWFGDTLMTNEFREISPDLPLKINADNTEQAQEAIRKYQPQIIEMRASPAMDELIDWCQQRGIKAMVYVPDTADYRKVIHSKADMVNLDDPVLYLQLLGEGSPQNTSSR
ncbi:glycerophosphodiester phosphodiesterase family protein [Parapedobacter tibetensis]|uniref:glycerophosphodiester phosphodiesterase family protein n=1 Tax=Parapedobacter tibetensis TaxID=2972951 RepID=UPI00214D16DE|nr:glycerophosphodiester phosphodiesterase family protein [Parapedobacter tibetensis]